MWGSCQHGQQLQAFGKLGELPPAGGEGADLACPVGKPEGVLRAE